MDAAEELFLDRGYMLATTVKIAERAGVTHAMLHYYFRTKEQIFLKVLDKNLNGFIEAVRPVMTATGNGNVWETLKGGITVFFDYLNTHRRLAPMLYDVLRNNPELLRSYRKGLAEMSERVRTSHVTMLRKEMDGGRMNRTDIGQLFYSIMTMCISTFLTIPVLDGMQGRPGGPGPVHGRTQNGDTGHDILETLRQSLTKSPQTRDFSRYIINRAVKQICLK